LIMVRLFRPLPMNFRHYLLLSIVLLVPIVARSASASYGVEEALRSSSYELGAAIDRPTLNQFYALRHDAPAWQLDRGDAQGMAQQFTRYIRAVLDEHGLSVRSYPFELFQERIFKGTPQALAEADVLASAIVLRMARSLSGGDPVPTSDPE